MLVGLRRHCPDCFVVAYDIGDRNSTETKLDAEAVRHALGTRFSFRRFPFDQFPPHMRLQCCTKRKHCGAASAGQYAWKPVILSALVAEFGAVLWLDAGSMPVSDENAIADVRHRLLHGSGFYTTRSSGTVRDWTHPGMLAALGISPRDAALLDGPNCNAAVVGFGPGNETATSLELLREWRACAMSEACIAPEGSSRKNHRQDQAALTVLAARRGMGPESRPWPHGFLGQADSRSKRAEEQKAWCASQGVPAVSACK